MSDSLLTDIQQEVKDYLYTNEFFRDIPIITEDILDINSDLDKAEAGTLLGPSEKFGCAIRIMTAIGGGTLPNCPSTTSLKGRLLFDVYEMPQFNRKTDDNGIGKHGLAIAENIWLEMKFFDTSEEISLQFYDSDTPVHAPTVVDNGLVVHRVEMFWACGGKTDDTERVATPVIVAESEGVVSITDDTVGAQIYYTTDGTRPTWQNGTLYAGGLLVVGASVTVKARAYFPGMRASLIASGSTADPGAWGITDDGTTPITDDGSTAING